MDDEEWFALAAAIFGAIVGCALAAILIILFGGIHVWKA
jgi:hypothetical protein